MLIAPVRFPITDGVVVAALKAALTPVWAPVTVQRTLPAAVVKPRRMVTVRNDSGPQDQLRSFRRYGINVWADDPVDAENIALDGMAALRVFRSSSVVSTDGFTGPYEVEDETPYLVGGESLTHFYWGVRLHVRGVNA